MKQPYKHFDLPTTYFTNKQLHFAPLKARDEAEIARRRTLPKGSLTAELQHKGLIIAEKAIADLDGDNLIEAGQAIGMACLGTAFYSAAKGAPVMRRRLSLPEFARHEDDGSSWSIGSAEAIDHTKNRLHGAAAYAGTVAALFFAGSLLGQVERQFGRYTGDTGLWLGAIGLAGEATHHNAVDIQDMVRAESLALLQKTKEVGETIGAYPSLAQLAQPLSPFAVYLGKEAPTAFVNNIEAAQQQVITAR